MTTIQLTCAVDIHHPSCTAQHWPHTLHGPHQETYTLRCFHHEQKKCNAHKVVPFGCPVYSTKDEILDGKPFHKQDIHSKLGLYLGVRHLHSRRTGLILSLDTGLVSSKFNYKVDKAFNTVEGKAQQHPWKSRTGLYTKPYLEHDGNTKPVQLTRGTPRKTTSARCHTGKIPAGGRLRPNQKNFRPCKETQAPDGDGGIPTKGFGQEEHQCARNFH